MRWTRAKYAGKNRPVHERTPPSLLRHGWRFAHNGVVFTGASSVAVTRYRYRGSTIPTPWTPKPAAAHTRLTSGQDTWSARCAETCTPGAAGGPGKPTGSNPDRAPRSDPTGAVRRRAGALAGRADPGRRAPPRARRDV